MTSARRGSSAAGSAHSAKGASASKIAAHPQPGRNRHTRGIIFDVLPACVRENGDMTPGCYQAGPRGRGRPGMVIEEVGYNRAKPVFVLYSSLGDTTTCASIV